MQRYYASLNAAASEKQPYLVRLFKVGTDLRAVRGMNLVGAG
jgi:hypothetical protein